MGHQAGRRFVPDLNRLGDLHLELGVEQRHTADLLEVRVHRIFGTARRLRRAGRPLAVAVPTSAVARDGGSVQAGRRFGFRREIVFLVIHQRNSLCVDARQQGSQHFGCQFNRVECVDEFVLGEVTLLASCF